MSEAHEVRFEEDGVFWVGQTITNGGDGGFYFGRDINGALHIRIVCDRRPTGGALDRNDCIIQDSLAILNFLNAWFRPQPIAYTTTVVVP